MKTFDLRAPPAMAVAANSTASLGAGIGTQLWSTVAQTLLTWSGTAWLASASSTSGTLPLVTSYLYGGL